MSRQARLVTGGRLAPPRKVVPCRYHTLLAPVRVAPDQIRRAVAVSKMPSQYRTWPLLAFPVVPCDDDRHGCC